MILIQVNFSYFSSFQARNSLLIFHKRWFGSVAPCLGGGASQSLVVVGWTTDEFAISLELVGGFWSIENPKFSYLWLTEAIQEL